MKRFLFVLIFLTLYSTSVALPPRPMESVTKYNVVLIHGAADSSSGFIGKCQNNVRDAYSWLEWKKRYETTKDSSWKLGGAPGMLGGPHERDDGLVTSWLDSAVFEDYVYKNGNPFVTDSFTSSVIYIQRSFANPAESPAYNALEIGDRTWKGPDGCSSRRSLIEEAQEIRAHGQNNLDSLRLDSLKNTYRTIPSRNILVAHSMGGVASREYVQGDYYNHDVDKVITLDSPHEGTGALAMLIDLADPRPTSIFGGVETFAQIAAWSTLAIVLKQNQIAAIALPVSFLSNWVEILAKSITNIALDYGYKYTDPLVRYINPDTDLLDDIFDSYEPGIEILRKKTKTDSLPMFRLLYAENALTFTDPGRGWYNSMDLVIPDGLTASLGNLFSQISSDAPAGIKFGNVFLSTLLGAVAGVSMQETGSSLIPTESGRADNTEVLLSPNVNVEKVGLNAAIHASESAGSNMLVDAIALTIAGLTAIDVALSWNQIACVAAKIGAVTVAAGNMVPLIKEVVLPVAQDFVDSHKSPVMAKYQSQWFADANTYTKMKGGTRNVTPLLMEEFLYEKPFVNLGLFVSDSTLRTVEPGCYYEADDANKQQLCEIGLYGTRDSISRIDTVKIAKNEDGDTLRYDTTRYYNGVNDRGDSIYYGPFKRQNYSSFKASPLKFKFFSDWDKVGVKIDRWERVDGLKPDGSDNPKGVPIRHMERYEVPAITVDNWIEKYSFVVDDLMPHRLRQIRMNFNYQEEIAWECDITKPDTSSNACAVYKRKAGNNWKLADTIGNKGYVPHPVKKNGLFNFEPRKYGFENLLSIQKDNQNTVTISTVNKIGLSNSQRFYYLFKATDNLLEPVWPKHDVVVNEVSNFEAYASVLDYQGFDVVGMRDSIWYPTGNVPKSLGNLQNMDSVRSEGSGNVYRSKISRKNLDEGEYHWVFNAITRNSAGNSNDSNDVYDVPFRVDVTPPDFELSVGDLCMNPDSSVFVSRFAWLDSSDIPDIRAMKWNLEHKVGTGFVPIVKLPSLYDVASKNFAVAWDKVPGKEYLVDGEYRVRAMAIDYAAPNLEAYDNITRLVDKIAGGNDDKSDWESLKDYNYNRTERIVEFRVDRTAPDLVFEKIGAFAEVVSSNEKYGTLSRPVRNQNLDYVSDDSLLQINYSVKELLGGRDSTAVTVTWKFIHTNDSAKSGRAGDSVWIQNTDNVGRGTWTEMVGMRLQDGDYVLRAVTRDEAKNAKSHEYARKIRMDRTAPKILSLVSSRLVYPDSATDFSATIKVSESGDVIENRTGMRCHYRVLGGDADGMWRGIDNKILKNDTVRFDIPVDAVGGTNGKRNLEAVCIDAAGNASVRTDLFHVGDRYPEIVSPSEDADYLTAEYIPIVGITPPSSANTENTTVYRLRYRYENSDEWLTENISVVSLNQSDLSANISKTAQSTEGVLGYLHNIGFSESRIYIELSTRSCETCEWRSDSTLVTLDDVVHHGEDPKAVLELSSPTFEVGKDSLEMSLRLENDYNGEYFLRIYAEDAKGVGLFDKTMEHVFANPFYGEPADTSISRGVWFYEKEGLYHLKWKGFSPTDSVRIFFDSRTFGETCLADGGKGNIDSGCRVSQQILSFSGMQDATESYLSDYPIWQYPAYTNSVMTVFGSHGHVTMQSSGAFRISSANISVNPLDIPVYFGTSEEQGFSFMESEISSSTNPWTTGWSVNPKSYGLNYVWDGITSTKSYPSAGRMKIHAEVVQNTLHNPYAILIDTTVTVVLPEMEVAFSALPEFYIVENATDSAASDAGEARLYNLGSMNIPYGVLYRDAYVSIEIEDRTGKIVRTLLDSSYTKANANRNAYSVLWDAKDGDGFAVREGAYVAKIVAWDLNGLRKEKTSKFDISLRKMVPDILNGVGLTVSEAKLDGEKNRYVPVPDYLIRTDIAAKYLPEEAQKGVSLDVDVSGTQNIYGYAPKRFSLAIKRHRKQLDLVVVTRFRTILDEINGWVFTPCSENDSHKKPDEFNTFFLSWDSANREKVIAFNKSYSDYGFDGSTNPSNGTLDLIVLTKKQYDDFINERKIQEISSQEEFDGIKNDAVWVIKEFVSGKDTLFKIPGTVSETIVYGGTEKQTGCDIEIEEEKEYLNKTCTYSDSGTTEKYNPNINLFELSFVPNETGRFYRNRGAINSHCTDDNWKRYKELSFSIKFKIPDTYWDAPFGMDNLVNRTIRFDHTNKTIFAKSREGKDGYWAALENDLKGKSVIGEGSYFDGTSWKFDRTYGLLTPYEMQSLPFLPANELQGGRNTFLFADEDANHQQQAYFDLKFYGPRNENDYFKAIVLGEPKGSKNGCDYNKETNYDAAYQLAINGKIDNPRCQISVTSKRGDSEVVSTPLFDAGYVYFYVGRNMIWSQGETKKIAFPAVSNWIDTISGICKQNVNWSAVKGTSDCKKYYEGGSKVHYYIGDFNDDAWRKKYVKDGFIKNPVNAPAAYHDPRDISYLDKSKMGSSSAIRSLVVKPNSSNYSDGKFFVALDTIQKLKGEKAGYSIDAAKPRLSSQNGVAAGFNKTYDTLYFDARDTVVRNQIYRDWNKNVPTQMKPVSLPMKKIFSSTNSWLKNFKVDSISLLYLDSSNHSHFTASSDRDSSDRTVRFKDSKDISVSRPRELVELKANLTEGQNYQLSYLKDGAYYAIGNFVAEKSGVQRLSWFDVNRSQGNTQFLLTWGGEGSSLYYSMYNLYVGSAVSPDKESTVQSLFGELSVTFPAASMQSSEDVTVRTAEADDYPFEVFNNMPLTGPVMEVLPSMTFDDATRLPRIQMQISKAEMNSNGVTPQTLKLYKIDFVNKKFVPLENALYGYLKSDGSAAVPATGSSTTATCEAWDSKACYPGENGWEYILISAETRTFSVFAAMSSDMAESTDFSLEVLPEVATSAERIVNVKGIGNYALYVDDDSLWNDRGDTTSPVELPFVVDSNGFAHIMLPSRETEIDTNYVFVVAKSEADAHGNSVELPVSPVMERVLTIPAEFSCVVPDDSLWLGLDNGFLAYGASCNHPGVGTVSLYQDGKLVTEIHGDIPDTVFYDGAKKLGSSRVGKIPAGVYESRYVGYSTLGSEQQLAGPLVYTDSVRPNVENFAVHESADILDRVYTVTAKVADVESGVASVSLSPTFGGNSLEKMVLLPDSLGNIVADLRLTHKLLAECVGCRLEIEFRVEDLGHNHVDSTFVTEKLYPYPVELALWYPSREGAGRTVFEFMGTGHNMDLSSVRSPWQSDVGLYLGSRSEWAAGNGRVDLGTSDSYTIETRIKRGNSPDTWSDIASFAGPGGLSIQLAQKGLSLRLSEGNYVWHSGEVLPSLSKTWTHLAVVAEPDGVAFYIDGVLAKFVRGGISAERELYGTFALGGKTGNSFVGNVSDIRFYSKALSGAEIAALSIPQTGNGEESNIVVVVPKDMNVLNGFTGQFSCAVAGNRYLVAGEEKSRLRMDISVEKAGNYHVVLYVRSANLSSVNVSVGENTLHSGLLHISNVWRASSVSGVTLSLAKGEHSVMLEVPEGVEIGGVALTENAVSPAMIAWGRSTSDNLSVVADTKIQAFLKYENYGDRRMLRPRLRLKNISSESINGYAVRYYFRGEDPLQVRASAFYPQNSASLSVHSESARTGYAEWSFEEQILVPGDSAFYGEGPHFGLYNTDWSLWNAEDDPSFVEEAVDTFAADGGIVVLDEDNNLIGGRCVEMEDETSIITKARVVASDVRNDNQSSEIHLAVQNLGNVALRNFDVEYYFYVEEGLAPILDVNHLASCSSANMEGLGSGRFKVKIHCLNAIGAGNVMENPVNISLHLSGWADIWNAEDDPGHVGLSSQDAEAIGICIYDSLGNRVYGELPQWSTGADVDLVDGDSVYVPDNGYHGENPILITKTEDGLILSLDSWSSVSLDLVNAIGVPLKSIFNGTLASGEQFVPVDWTGINTKTTYLVLKVNGSIKTTRLLSLL